MTDDCMYEKLKLISFNFLYSSFCVALSILSQTFTIQQECLYSP